MKEFLPPPAEFVSRPTEILTPCAEEFIESYLELLNRPISLLNHVGTIDFISEKGDLDERRIDLTEYFSHKSQTGEDWIIGRAIFAEVVGAKILSAIFTEELNHTGMSIELVPTSLDKSHFKPGEPYQKGTDLLLVRNTGKAANITRLPECGFDITIGDNGWVKHKRRLPGLQTATAIPVTVLPLRDLTYDRRRNYRFHKYLDLVAKKEVLENGEYTPLNNLDEYDIALWKIVLKNKISDGIAICRNRLQSDDNKQITSFPYMEDVIRHLDKTKAILTGATFKHTVFQA